MHESTHLKDEKILDLLDSRSGIVRDDAVTALPRVRLYLSADALVLMVAMLLSATTLV